MVIPSYGIMRYAKMFLQSDILQYCCAMAHNINWQDLQYVLTVASRGSLAAAARVLSVNHSTVLRRINAFEERHEIRLFDRLRTGYTLTDEGVQLLDAARSIETTIVDLERRIAGRDLKLEGTIRLTTTDAIFVSVVSPHLTAFRNAYPEIRIELMITANLVDLSKRDADVAIRPSAQPPDTLVCKRIARLGFSIYGSPAYLAENPASSLGAHRWIGPDVLIAESPPARWMRDNIPESAQVMAADSFLAMRDCAERGLGLALMPCCVGDGLSRLRRVSGLVPEIDTSLWILTHHDLLRATRIRVFTDYMLKALTGDRRLLEGA